MITKNPAAIWRDSRKLEQALGKVGKIMAVTTIYSPPSGYEHQVPYNVAIVEFEDGLKHACEVVDVAKDSLKIGLKVKAVIRRIGQSEPEELIEYSIKVKPLRCTPLPPISPKSPQHQEQGRSLYKDRPLLKNRSASPLPQKYMLL